MKNNRWLLGLTLPAVLLFAGCHVVLGPDDDDEGWFWYCNESGCYRCTPSGCDAPDPRRCTADWECASGYCDYDSGRCVDPPPPPADCTKTAQCGEGYACIDGTCVPQRPPCESDAACGDGAYCSNGACKVSDTCTDNADCADVGANYVCDARGSCVPGPTGPETCESGATCAEGICVDGECGICSENCGGGQTCEFAAHCGEGRVCLDGRCVNSCDTDGDCGSAQKCLGNVCVAAHDGCVEGEDCASGEVCVNQTCYVDCSSSGTCDNAADTCSSAITVGDKSVRVCIPDYAAAPQCELTKDCEDNEQCVNGVCRTVCDNDDDCANCDDGPVCGAGGFCMTEDEVNPQCKLTADCKTDELCLDNQCVKL